MDRVQDAKGLVAEFETVESLIRGIEIMRSHGYRELEAHLPFPSPAVIKALDLRESSVPFLTLVGGLLGMAAGYGIPWWTNAVDYPVNVGGRPDHAVPAFIPLTFETGVLVAGTFAFFGFLWLCRLPSLWHPIMEVEGFHRTTTDRYWLRVEATDGKFGPERTREHLRELDPLRIEAYGDME